MRFFDRAEATQTVRKLERRSGKASPQITLFYTSGATDYVAAASAITDSLRAFSLGAFSHATLICTGLPWGDFWKDDDNAGRTFMNGAAHLARPSGSTTHRVTRLMRTKSRRCSKPSCGR